MHLAICPWHISTGEDLQLVLLLKDLILEENTFEELILSLGRCVPYYNAVGNWANKQPIFKTARV